MLLYNSATRQREEFVPRVAGKVSMYTCGPTVYHFAHIVMPELVHRYHNEQHCHGEEHSADAFHHTCKR